MRTVLVCGSYTKAHVILKTSCFAFCLTKFIVISRPKKKEEKEKDVETEEDKVSCRTALAKNILR